MKANFSLDGKVALVTGASYGIGFALARGFAGAGATICFNDINQELVDKGIAAYKEIGIEAHGYVCDVTNEAQVEAMVAQIKEEVGIIDILVNNAGIIMRIPMLEQTREIVRKINDIYGEVLVEPDILLPKNQICRRLPGIDGKAKMSKTLGNCIYLSDNSKILAEKIKNMYTDPLHIKVSDPGHIEGNVVFTYLDAFCEDKKIVDDMKEHYQRGGLGDVKVKKFLLEVLENILSPIRQRRADYESNPDEVLKILREGTENACEKASEVLKRLKRAMKINYFD